MEGFSIFKGFSVKTEKWIDLGLFSWGFYSNNAELVFDDCKGFIFVGFL